MKNEGFIKISDNKASQIYGGSSLMFLGALLPIVLPAVTSLVSSFKLLFSDKGEVKSKDGTTAKWEKYEEKSSALTKLHFID